MNWHPNLEDRAEKKGEGDLINKVGKLIYEDGSDIENLHSDNTGVFAIETEKSIVCCKRQVYVNTVSCTDGLPERAQDTGKQFVMYIEENSDGSMLQKFYKFPVDTVIDVARVNVREVEGEDNSDMPMKNFPIKLGEEISVDEV